MNREEDYRKAFGKKIRKLRREKDISQQEMAVTLNISAQAISKWERGEAFPSPSKIPQIAEILSVNIQKLFEDI